MFQSIVFHTLGQLATGILLFIAFVPPSRIGPGFGRFHTLLALGLWLIAFRGNFPLEFYVFTVLILLAFSFSGKDLFYYPFLSGSCIVSFHFLMKSDIPAVGTFAALLLHLPPALVLGASAVAMLLGHWYLVAPELSITYLKVVTIGLVAALLIRSGFLIEVLLHNHAQLEGAYFYQIYGIFLLQRIAIGLFLTLVLSVLTYFCVRIRSTQSATGILYVVLVFCLVGEVTGAYLFIKTGLLL